MPIVKASNGVRPEIRALGVIELNKAVSPTEINAFVGTGNYAAKYITFLRRLGFEFETTKDGRAVTAYILVKEPANAADLRSAKPKVKQPKVAKPKAAKAKVVKKAKVKVKVPTVDVKAVKAAASPRKPIKSNGEVASFNVDPDWDSVGDVSKLVA